MPKGWKHGSALKTDVAKSSSPCSSTVTGTLTWMVWPLMTIQLVDPPIYNVFKVFHLFSCYLFNVQVSCTKNISYIESTTVLTSWLPSIYGMNLYEHYVLFILLARDWHRNMPVSFANQDLWSSISVKAYHRSEFDMEIQHANWYISVTNKHYWHGVYDMNMKTSYLSTH
jgi:hypothetical protein